MSTHTTGHVSLKDKIKSHLPGHNKDANHNGIPDRMEHGSTTGHPTLSDRNGNGAPDRLEHGHTAVGGANDLNRNGIPDNLERRGVVGGANDLNRNGIPDNLERQGSYGTTGVYQTTTTTVGGLNDLNRNGIPDNLERQGSYGQTSVGGLNDLNRNGIPDNLERQGSYGQTTGFTDLNRNGIPDQLEGQTGFGFVGSVQANQTSVVDVREAPTIVERVEKAAVVHEVYKTEEVVQIQPVINREREQLDVYEVVQPMKEREVVATEVRNVALPAQTRATIVEDNSAFLAQRSAPSDFSTREVAATMSQTVTNAPIVHETITHRVIEEVQPVIYKEIDRPVLIKETLPIYEKIVEAPHAHHTVLPVRDMGTHVTTTTTTTGFTDLNRDGIPDQLQGGMYQTTGLHSGLQSQGVYGAQSVGGLNDLNRNGIPDNMEARHGQRSIHDLNGNGIPDSMERAHGLKDLNGNGIDDSLERRMGQTTLNPNTRL